MRARIYQPPKNAMQSGWAGTHEWVLEFEPAEPRRPDPLMGWIGSADTQRAGGAALRHARGGGGVRREARASPTISQLPQTREFKPKAYADNFRFGRMENWTH